jgi:hypothetical protein
LFEFKALASALLLSTAVFGAAVEDLGKGAQPKDIDVSSHPSDINWKTIRSKGISFAYIRRPKKPVRAMVSSSCRTPRLIPAYKNAYLLPLSVH